MNESRGNQQKKSRKNKAMEKGQEAGLEREVAAFELVVERETGSTYHLKNQLQKKKKQNTMIETQKVMRRIRSVELAVKTLRLQMTLQDVTHAISGSTSIV